jgi:hypothetical protein
MSFGEFMTNMLKSSSFNTHERIQCERESSSERSTHKSIFNVQHNNLEAH